MDHAYGSNAHDSHGSDRTPRRRAAGIALALLALLGLASTIDRASTPVPEQETAPAPSAAESPRESGPGDAPRAHARRGVHVEPREEPAALRQALETSGAEESPALRPASAVVVRALERVRDAPAPPDEVFALVKVTDRRSGERHYATRGEADPALGVYLDDPRSAPPGRLYLEIDGLEVGEDFEVATRSVRVVYTDPFEGEPSPQESRELELLERYGLDATALHVTGPILVDGLSHRIGEGLRARAASGELDLQRGASFDLVPVMIALEDVPELSLPKSADPEAGGLLWVGLDIAAAREKAIIARKQRVAELQSPLLCAVADLGGVVEYASWMSGLVQVHLPAGAIQDLADHPAVFSLEYIPAAEVQGHYFRGDDAFVAMNAEDFYQNHSGFHGLSSKHPATSRVVVALGEECIDTNSPAWLTGAPGSANRGRFYDCDPGSCTLGGLEVCWDDEADDGEFPPHGHYVAGVMAGDLMDGQVPGFSQTERRRMSGTCPECLLYFFQDQGLDDRTRVHDKACEKGVDIFEASLGWSSGTICDGEGFMDDSVEDLINCDAAFVASAGNSGSPGCELECCDGTSYTSCSTLYPADHPWTLAVSGIKTEDPCDSAGDYYTSTCVFDECSSRGGGSYDGNDGYASLIDLAAPWRVGMGISPGTIGSGGGSLVGTSFGAPLVAGLMGNVMDWYKQHIGTGIFYNNRARNFMLLMGDRSATKSGTSQNVITPSKYWGFGRVSLMPFDQQSSLIIQRLQISLGKNQSYTWTHDLAPDGRLYKAVLWHTGKDYSNEPRLDLRLDPQGCPAGDLVVNRLDAKSYAAHQGINGCTGMKVTIKNTGVGSSGTRTIHYAAYAVPQTNERQF